MSLWIDILLASLAVALAIRCLISPTLTKCVFLFFAFGLTLALSWARLGAVDVAIAEAAIGAGFLGVLLIEALRDFPPSRVNVGRGTRGKVPWGSIVTSLIAVALFLLLALEAVWNVGDGGGLTARAAENLERSGVDHPVTAVLLNYRSYDTWLEVGVVLIALLAIFAVGNGGTFARRKHFKPDPLLVPVIRLLAPVLFLVGGFLLYLGKTEPGGAFQAAVLWGAAGILVYLGGWPLIQSIPRWLLNIVLTIGFGLFMLLGLAFMWGGGAWFEYPPTQAGNWILLVETLAALSIAAALTTIFAFFHEMREPKESAPMDEVNGSAPDASLAPADDRDRSRGNTPPKQG